MSASSYSATTPCACTPSGLGMFTRPLHEVARHLPCARAGAALRTAALPEPLAVQLPTSAPSMRPAARSRFSPSKPPAGASTVMWCSSAVNFRRTTFPRYELPYPLGGPWWRSVPRLCGPARARPVLVPDVLSIPARPAATPPGPAARPPLPSLRRYYAGQKLRSFIIGFGGTASGLCGPGDDPPGLQREDLPGPDAGRTCRALRSSTPRSRECPSLTRSIPVVAFDREESLGTPN